MREATFLKQNEKKWKDFEKLVIAPRGSVAPDEIANLYIEISDDLSYARTHFPNSKSVQYLNGLAGQVHMAILRNKKSSQGSFTKFITTELPLILAIHRAKLYWSFGIFVIAIIIGALSTANDIGFVRLILGDAYVEMTLDNMANGAPLAVYDSGGEIESFLGITVNNIKVSFLAFVGGLFLAMGTGYMLLFNGIMVGAFFSFLFQYGYGEEAILTVMIHGTLELSAIVIAGMGGFVLGHSIMFPRSFTRMESLRQGAMDGIKILVGLVPIFVVAGFLEGFVTRHTDMPVVVSLLIILGSLSFIVFYFVILPLRVQSSQAKEAEVHG